MIEVKKINFKDGKICSYIKNFMEKNTYNLIETVVERLAEELLISFTNLIKVRLEISKPKR